MPSATLNPTQIYFLANEVLRLGELLQGDSETWWSRYVDERIVVIHTPCFDDTTFRVYARVPGSIDSVPSCSKLSVSGAVLVLETHFTSEEIYTKDDLLRDMLRHHGSCDRDCPGFTNVVAKRAYEIYRRRAIGDNENGVPVSTTDSDYASRTGPLDDWLRAEHEILGALQQKFAGAWDVSNLRGPYQESIDSAVCVILRRGAWIQHLVDAANT